MESPRITECCSELSGEQSELQGCDASHGVWGVKGYVRYSHYLICVYFLSSGLSFFVSQFAVAALLLYTLVVVTRMRIVGRQGVAEEQACRGYPSFSVPLSVWLLVALIASLVGVDPGQSLVRFISSGIWLALPFCVAYSLTVSFDSLRSALSRINQYLLLLGISMSLCGVNSLLVLLSGHSLLPGIPGPVTGSGQLVLALPAMLGLFLCRNHVLIDIGTIAQRLMRLSGCLFLLIVLLAWSNYFTMGIEHQTLLWVFRIGCLVVGTWVVLRIKNELAVSVKEPIFSLRRSLSDPDSLSFRVMAVFLLVICFSALVINLKRGPWVAVVIELLTLGLIMSRRIVVNTLLGVAIVLICLIPARERLLDFADDFAIRGGRENMWQLGVELVQRFPLGVGLGNAKYMRTLDPSLPPSHRHMHNNLLNVTVELGWMGLAAYIWWMVAIVKISLKTRHAGLKRSGEVREQGGEIEWYNAAVISLCLALSIVGWQLAGLVEYNFGDGEVRFIALSLMGFILALSRISERAG